MDRNVSVSVQELVLTNLLSLPENRFCADCRIHKPDWVSLNYGVFVCYKCSGVHRSLGAHNTKVRSTKLDGWTMRQLYFMFYLNNQKANEYWEAKIPEQFLRQSSTPNARQFAEFIRAKYVDKAFLDPEKASPIEEANRKIEAECQEEPDLEKLCEKKQAEMMRTLKIKSLTTLTSLKDKKIAGRTLRKADTMAITQSSALTPSPTKGKKIVFNFSPEHNALAKSMIDVSPSVNSIASTNLPLFEGLTLKSRESTNSIKSFNNLRVSQPRKLTNLTPFRENSSRLSIQEKNPNGVFTELRISAVPSIDLFDFKELKSTESQLEDEGLLREIKEPKRPHLFRASSIEFEMENMAPNLFKKKPDFDDFLHTLGHIEEGSEKETPMQKFRREEDSPFAFSFEQENVQEEQEQEQEDEDEECAERHQSISITLLEAQKSFVHLKRPSEPFQIHPIMITSDRVRNSQRSGKLAKLSVLTSGALLHILFGYLYSWGAISSYITSYLSKGSGSFDYFQGASCNILLFLGMSIGLSFSNKVVNSLGMRMTVLIGCICISSAIFGSSFISLGFINFLLLTLIPGFFIGLLHQLPSDSALFHFNSATPLKIFFYVSEGLGAFLFISLYPLIISHTEGSSEIFEEPLLQDGLISYPEEITTSCPKLLQLIAAVFLAAGLLGGILLRPNLNSGKNEESDWGEKAEGLLKNRIPSFEGINSPYNSQGQKVSQSAGNASLNSPKLLFMLTVLYFIFSGFFFYSYKITGTFYGYSDGALSMIGAIGMLILIVGTILGVLMHHKLSFKASMALAVIAQGTLGVLTYLSRESKEAFLVFLLTALLLHGIGFSLIIQETSQISQEASVKGSIFFGYALSNVISFALFKATIFWDFQEELYLILTIPLILALLTIICYPKMTNEIKAKNSITRT